MDVKSAQTTPLIEETEPGRATGREGLERIGAEFRTFMSHWPTGVTVITSLKDTRPVGCTVNAMMSVSLEPPLLVVALANGSGTLAAVQETGAFGLSVLSTDQKDLCYQFSHGSSDDRFSGIRYTRLRGLPVLADVVASTVCEVYRTIVCGDHVLVIGRPVWHTTDEVAVTPLVFHEREYRELG